MNDSTAGAPNVLGVLVLLLSQFTASSQANCRRPPYSEWHPQPRNITLRLSLMQKTCSGVTQCWNGLLDPQQRHWTNRSYAFPQLCPLEIQSGDGLITDMDSSLEGYGVNLVNVSKEEFESCSIERIPNKDFLFSSDIRGTMRVHSKWLSPGVHYFIATHNGSSQLCELGLRIGVLVKEHSCNSSPHLPLCSGNGVCRAKAGQSPYSCRCYKNYLKPYCEDLDMCSEASCLIGATCISIRPAGPDRASSQCLCPSGFTGTFCTENASPACRDGCKCEEIGEKYICLCPDGCNGSDCDPKLENTTLGHPQKQAYAIESHRSTCVCSSSACREHGAQRRPSPHAICVARGERCYCRCCGSYSGKNCEDVIDYCRLLAVNCLDDGSCLRLIGGHNCLCAPGRTEEFRQYVDEVSWIYSGRCLNGGTCVSVSQPTASRPYMCPCSSGYTGINCSLDGANCTEECQNSMCCSLNENVHCKCPPGFTGQFCEMDIDDCAGKPCGTHSICRDGVNSYDCFCAPGFVGHNCEVEINECLSQPCLNGASCSDELNSFSCVCPAGTTGGLCEIDINECLSTPCLNKGTCLDLANEFGCICHVGFTGLRCEVDIDECASSPCKNGATCSDRSGNYYCHCADPFKGVNCELLPCEAYNPCENGADCVEEADLSRFPLGFRCHCRRGFAGPNCELNVDECASNPCVGGFCYDVADGFYCLCNPGYAGERCEQDIDDCISNMCENNSTCVDFHLSYRCICGLGWEGEFCERETDECSSNPCKNSGTCTDLLGAYTCSCPHGWTGPDCGEDVDECASSPCFNGAQCVESDYPGQFSCVCPPFFAGPLCTLTYDPCEVQSNLCVNSSTCISRPDGSVRCLCSAGSWCEQNMDECSLNPCQNEGRCINGLNGYRCLCSTGFTGTDCAVNTDECASNPCIHGSCSDRINAYVCQCESGWSGPRCEINIDDCKDEPCLNGGCCVDLVDKYACLCAKGYTGKQCEVDLDACLEKPVNFPLCFNGGTCLDGPGFNFTCRCPVGFAGTFCEVDVNECCSEPCFHGGVCQDLINGYQCHCRPGWTGLRCEDDINECLPQPCNQGLCIQNEPGHGYSCFCQPGFVGRTCEYNYDDCLRWPCPDGLTCVDGVNSVSCIAMDINVTSVPAGLLTHAEQPEDVIYGRYYGTSFLEFEGINLNAVSNITLRFQTQSLTGTLLYMDQGPIQTGFFFIKMHLYKGILQYDFSCSLEETVQSIDTKVQVHDGKEYLVRVRQSLSPCEAEVAVSDFRQVRSVPIGHWSGPTIQMTGHVFIGGLPHTYSPHKGAEPLYNYTGCIEIIEMNTLRGFRSSSAITGSNVDDCRASWPLDSLEDTVLPWPAFRPEKNTSSKTDSGSPLPTVSSLECFDGPCLNGGTCHPLLVPSGAAAFICDCPLHYTGRLCEKETSISVPFFTGMSYLELQAFTSSDPGFETPSSQNTGSIYLTVQTKSAQGTILYTQEQKSGDRFLQVFLQDGSLVARLGCSDVEVLEIRSSLILESDTMVPIMVRYLLPVSEDGGLCVIEIVAGNGTANRCQKYVSGPSSEVVFRPTFLGGVPFLFKLHPKVGNVSGFVGCILELQVNSRELYLVRDALQGQNIHNCYTQACQDQPCRNGGTCVSDAETWFCVCVPLFSGKLCQYSACERNPCARGATCIPKSPLEAVCLCPHGRQGLLCNEAINITRPRFSGLDDFGYMSYLAYLPIPSMSYFYEFRLKVSFSNNASAMADNLILFSGQKGQGNSGDDFFALGLRNRRVIHKYNLGSGVATFVSDRLNPRIKIHTVYFGRYLKNGWLKVDGQRNKTGSSPGHLATLTTFSQLYVGGYREYTPELLPIGAKFKNGFQGCIFDIGFRTRRDGKFHRLAKPESGRSVGQCGVSPCTQYHCQNGGTCVDSGSSVYCQCAFGWKGALCSEKVAFCDMEHVPPPSCSRGSTCVPLPDGYTCQCPLGTGGQFCQQVLSISDPFFNANLSSWMAFPPVSMRRRAHLQLQFQTLSPEGILFYMAQYLSARAGDFISVSLSGGHVQLRYNLGDGTVILQSPNRVDLTGRTWHMVKAGREGNQGYLDLDEYGVVQNSSSGMTSLDVATLVFVGGVSDLNAVSPDAMDKEPVGFTGGVREVIINGHDLELTESGALRGASVSDWDGTRCGYKVCRNGGSCRPLGLTSYHCLCPPAWTGTSCEEPVHCTGALCLHGSLCIPNVTTGSYSCMCALGWHGKHCDQRVSMTSARFAGNSYMKYKDPKYSSRNLMYSQVSFNLSASSRDGLILWMGRAESEDDDYLAVGLQDSRLKIAVNLGKKVALPLISRNASVCCEEWKHISFTHNRTVMQAFVDGDRVIFEDIDPFEQYVAINYGGVYHFGGFETNRDVASVTSDLFTAGFVGSIKDVVLYQDTRMTQILQTAEGFNVF